MKKKIKLDGFLLVATPLEQIVDRADKDWDGLEKEYPLLRQSGDYVAKILDFQMTSRMGGVAR